jgi:hypothetical protein
MIMIQVRGWLIKSQADWVTACEGLATEKVEVALQNNGVSLRVS